MMVVAVEVEVAVEVAVEVSGEGVEEGEQCSELEVEEPEVGEVGEEGRGRPAEKERVRRSRGSVVCVTSRAM